MTPERLVRAYAAACNYWLDAAWDADRKGLPGAAAAMLFEAKRNLHRAQLAGALLDKPSPRQ